MSNSAQVATAGEGDSPRSSLSDEQLSAFWASGLDHRDAARRMARRFVPKHSADDVVDTAAILFVESLRRPRKPARFPETDLDFRRRFLAVVRNHAIDCVRHRDGGDRPVHSHWGDEPEPIVGGRNVADRELDQVFSRNDRGEYDAPAPVELRDKDRADELNQILRCHLVSMPRMQRQVIQETFIQDRKRAEVARRLGISVNTYDNHLQAAFRTLRHLLSQDADAFTEVDRSRWYDLIEELCERYEASRVRRVAKPPRERAGLEREPSTTEGERSTSERDAGKSSRSDAA